MRAIIGEEDKKLHGGEFRKSVIQVETLQGKILTVLSIEEEAFILAEQGDLIIRSIGEDPAVFIDFKRPVPGRILPEALLFLDPVKAL